MDIDHFKSINDTYGHLQGDSILKEIGAIINQSIRNIDFPARYGGEEFVVIAPNTTIEDTTMIADRIRQSTESHKFIGEKESIIYRSVLGYKYVHSRNR